MRYRLPLELELTILELAAPPLVKPRLHDRVRFFINVSLAHRFFTAWAQDKLHDQFLYTYRARDDEHARLKKRFEAGFGPDRPLRRLYLDLTGLPANIVKRTKPGADSISATIDGRVYGAVSLPSGACHGGEGGTSVREQACDAVVHFEHPEDLPPPAGYWKLCAMISSYSQALDTLWLKHPPFGVDINHLPPPRALYIDDGVEGDRWARFEIVPVSSETVLFLRYMEIFRDVNDGDLDPRQLVMDQCWASEPSLRHVLLRFHRLETLVLFQVEDTLLSMMTALPTTIRRVQILQHDIDIDDDPPVVPNVLSRLDSFTFVWLKSSPNSESEPSAGDVSNCDALANLKQTVESTIVAPRCIFKYFQTTKSPEDALADALAGLGLDSS